MLHKDKLLQGSGRVLQNTFTTQGLTPYIVTSPVVRFQYCEQDIMMSSLF